MPRGGRYQCTTVLTNVFIRCRVCEAPQPRALVPQLLAVALPPVELGTGLRLTSITAIVCHPIALESPHQIVLLTFHFTVGVFP